MGITIHYQGNIANQELIPKLCMELTDIAMAMGWEAHHIPAEDDTDCPLTGVILAAKQGLEPLPFIFDRDGVLRNLTALMDPADNNFYTFIISCKTQFSSPADHAWIIGLLKYIQQQYIPELKVTDEGEFWETGDIDLLAKRMNYLASKINQISDNLTSLPAPPADATPEKIANLIQQQLQSNPIDSTEHIAQINQHLNELHDDNISFGSITETDELAAYEESFLKYVDEYESTPMTSYAKELINNKIPLPPPEELTASQLHEKLWEVIKTLAKMRVFLYSTNHLSDRELYIELWNDLLNHEVPCLFYNPNSAWHLDILGSGSEADTHLWLRYYATEDERKDWNSEFPEDPIPPCETPPFSRDHLLPRCGY